MDSVPPASRFLSTLSLRRATRLFLEIYTLFKNFYPRSPCGERRVVHVAQDPSPGRISIHALLAESDGCRIEHDAAVAYDFYPRSPCGERLVNLGNIATTRTLFLSTLSLRRATARPRYYSMGRYISIHALLAESDHSFSHAIIILVLFLSTLSLRRATI